MRSVRATIPLPTVDNQGIAFPQAEVDWFERALLAVASGYRKHLWVRGAWDGGERVYEEPIAVYVTTIEPERLDALTDLLARARTVFGQEAILVELSAVECRLLVADGLDAQTRDAPVSEIPLAEAHGIRG